MPTKPASPPLSSFSEEERAVVKRLIRPQGIRPNPDFESEQFMNFLAQLDVAYGELRSPGSSEAPSLRSIHKVPKSRPRVLRTA